MNKDTKTATYYWSHFHKTDEYREFWELNISFYWKYSGRLINLETNNAWSFKIYHLDFDSDFIAPNKQEAMAICIDIISGKLRRKGIILTKNKTNSSEKPNSSTCKDFLKVR